ncbi:peroxisome biogenesis factor 10-like, partial [Trifolium medium]|nr:peroxisome biogenesis factor 10-like [Trifolium medium]
ESAESYYGENARGSSSPRVYAASELSPSSTLGQSTSTLTRLKEKLGGFWLHMVQRWPTVHYSY